MIDTTDMTSKSRYLYEIMRGSSEFDFPVDKTNGSSKNSYSFPMHQQIMKLFAVTG